MSIKGPRSKLITLSLTAVALLLVAGWIWQSQPGYIIESGVWPVEKAWIEHRSGQMVEVQGSVVRILTDDQDEPANQKFVIRLKNGQSLLVVHNIAKAGKVPVGINHEVTVRGEYLWTEPGGTIR